MNSIEKLISEYDDELSFIFVDYMPKGLSGLIIDKVVYIDDKLPDNRKKAVVAEEIGHHKTAVGNIVDYNDHHKMKAEKMGRKWSYKKLVPKQDLLKFIHNKEQVFDYEIAENFEVPDEIVKEVIEMYRVEGEI